MEKEYYIKMNNENYGPYSFAQVCSLGVFDTTFVSVPQDNAGWRMAKDVPELQGFTITEETTSLQAPESSQFFVREGFYLKCYTYCGLGQIIHCSLAGYSWLVVAYNGLSQ